MKPFNLVFIAILMIALLAIVPAVSATDTFEGNYYDDSTSVSISVDILAMCNARFSPPNGCQNLYDNVWSKQYQFYDNRGSSQSYYDVDTSAWSYSIPYYTADVSQTTFPLITTKIQSSITGSSDIGGGNRFNFYWTHVSGNQPVDRNFTINVKSTTSGLNIPRADVTMDLGGGSSVEGKTDLNGNVTFSLVNTGSSRPVTISKAGYNTLSSSATVSGIENYQSFNLDDITWDGGGAQVYLDLIDKDTKSGVTYATAGIQNTTATIDQWTYITSPTSTVEFTKTGPYNISVGQTVVMSAFKTGEYDAAHTDPFTIPGPISHVTLELVKVVPPVNVSGAYFYPVTIADATNNAAISNSNLSSALSDTGYGPLTWYNSTSSSGKFNVTGTGAHMETSINLGDILILQGSAAGYQTNGFALSVTAANSGQTQFINLVPNAISPISGQFIAQVSVYDDRTTASLPGVAIGLNTGTVKTSSSSGSASFMNLTAGTSYTLTASKSGYTTLTKTFTGGSGAVVSVNVPMSATTVNPTVKPTTTGTGISGSGTEASDTDISSYLRKNIMGLLSLMVLAFILFLVAMILRAYGIIK